jgi:ribonuclease HI
MDNDALVQNFRESQKGEEEVEEDEYDTVLEEEKCSVKTYQDLYAILQCTYVNIIRAYRNKRILILSDSQATLRALSGPKVMSVLVAECLNTLSALAGMNQVTLARVLGHSGILGNEEADKLARPCHNLVLSRLLEYLSVRQERQLVPGL